MGATVLGRCRRCRWFVRGPSVETTREVRFRSESPGCCGCITSFAKAEEPRSPRPASASRRTRVFPLRQPPHTSPLAGGLSEAGLRTPLGSAARQGSSRVHDSGTASRARNRTRVLASLRLQLSNSPAQIQDEDSTPSVPPRCPGPPIRPAGFQPRERGPAVSCHSSTMGQPPADPQ